MFAGWRKMLTIDTRETHVYPVMILTAVAAGLIVQYLLNTRRGIRKDIAGIAILAGVFFSLGGGLLLTFITSKGQYFGLSSLGGLVGLYAANVLVAVIAKRPYYPTIMAQDATLVLPLMYGISKIGCFCAGCCRGAGYHGFGAVTYIEDAGSITVLPVQLLETLSFFGIFALGMLWFHQKKNGAVHVVFIGCMVVKFALDFLRESHTGLILSQTQVFCLILLAAEAVWCISRKTIKSGGKTHAI